VSTGSTAGTGATLHVAYFDGVSARPRPAQISVDGGRLCITGEGVALQVPLAEVRWPERTRHGRRVAHLRDGGSLEAPDALAWDAWARASGMGESLVVKAQQNWRATIAAVAVLLVLVAAGYVWGVPWLGRSALAVVPASVDRSIGEAAQRSLESYLLLPSKVPPQRQQALRAALAKAVARADTPQRRMPAWELHFATSAPRPGGAAGAPRTQLGPNAFALPGGIVYVTDEMLELLDGRDDVLLGVLGHELGHVQRRHGMRLLVQASVLGAVASLAWGDFNALLSAVPVLLGQSAYSRGFEREADLDAIDLLRANGLSPALMAELFERLGQQRAATRGAARAASGSDAGEGFGGDLLGISFASHPADVERIRAFREAAR
jgi:Zn-dependent protease with chaperone function